MSLSVPKPRDVDHNLPSPVERANALLPPLTTKNRERVHCPSPEHEDKHPSCDYTPDSFKCWACGEYGDKLDHHCLVHGLTIRQALDQLGIFDGGPLRLVRKPKPADDPPYRIPKALSRAMHSSPEFSLNWTLAKLLASRHPIGAQRDLLLSWDWLERRGFDVPVAWDLCKLLRGEAFLRYGDAKRAENPHEYARCVARLVEEIET